MLIFFYHCSRQDIFISSILLKICKYPIPKEKLSTDADVIIRIRVGGFSKRKTRNDAIKVIRNERT